VDKVAVTSDGPSDQTHPFTPCSSSLFWAAVDRHAPAGSIGANRDEALVRLDQLRDAFWEVRALHRRLGRATASFPPTGNDDAR
jgi:hypothetical protein